MTQTGKFSVLRYMDTKRSRFVEFDMDKAQRKCKQRSGKSSLDLENEGFMQVDDEDDDLPF